MGIKFFLPLAVALVLACVAGAQPGGAEKLADEGLRLLEAQQAAYKRAIDKASASMVALYLVESSPEGMQRHGDGLMPWRRNFDDEDDIAQRSVGLASGVVLDKAGLVLTCYHVLRPIALGKSYIVYARTADGRLLRMREIHAADPRSDLAVIRLQADELDLTPMAIGDGSKLVRGQQVIALGNTLGAGNDDGRASASVGIVANLLRKGETHWSGTTDRKQALSHWGALVQTDCRLNMGVSGGALVNLRGEWVGVITALAAQTGQETPGGFALPIDALTRRVIETLKAGREVEYGFLGIEPKPLADGEGPGVRVGSGSSRRPGGLVADDVIVRIEGKPIHNPNDLVLNVGAQPVGKALRIDVLRGGAPLALTVRLGKYPINGKVIFTVKRPDWMGLRVDHLSMLNGNRVMFGDEGPSSGVMIREVVPGSPAEASGIGSESVIVAVNRQPVDDPDEFDKLVRAAVGTVRLTTRDGKDFLFPPPGKEGPNPEPKSRVRPPRQPNQDPKSR